VTRLLLVGGLAKLVEAALAAADSDDNGPIGVIGPPRLARKLSRPRRPAIAIAEARRPLRNRPLAVCSAIDALPLQDQTLAAIVAVEPGRRNWRALLAAWSHPVQEGGAIVVISRLPPREMARRALCAGLGNIEQRFCGRLNITSGIVAKLPRPTTAD
jgi:hypothetical protein